MLKSLIWRFWDPKTSKSKILTSWGHLSGWLDAKSFDLDVPRMLKSSIWMFKDPEASILKILTSWGHLSGRLDVKIIDLEAWGPKNFLIKDFNILGPSVWLAGC